MNNINELLTFGLSFGIIIYCFFPLIRNKDKYSKDAGVIDELSQYITSNRSAFVQVIGYEFKIFMNNEYIKENIIPFLLRFKDKKIKIEYMLHEISCQEKDFENFIEMIEKDLKNKGVVLGKNLELEIIVRQINFDNDDIAKYKEQSKTNHYALIRGIEDNYAHIWIEENHPINKTRALNCEFVDNALNDFRYDEIKRRLGFFSKYGEIRYQYAKLNESLEAA